MLETAFDRIARPGGSARWVAVLAGTAAASLFACSPETPTAGGPAAYGALGLQPALIPSPSNASALPINRIRASAARVPDSVVVGEVVLDVNPAADSWTVGLNVDAPGAVTVYVTVYLINMAGDGTEEVQFSGRAGPFEINGLPVAPDVPIVRGPLANLSVTSVTIDAAPALLPLGATATLAATATSNDGSVPTVFWTSLSPSVLSMAGADATSVSIGTAQVVASAGSWSDTVSIDVTNPDSIPPSLLSTAPSPDALGAPRGLPVTATFDEAIAPASVNGTTFVLRDSLGAVVPATLSAVDATARLTPSTALEAAHRYTATLGPGITDLAGNALAGSVSWSFTTGGLALLGGSFDPGLGTLVAIAFDEVAQLLYLHDDFSDTIRVFDQSGSEVGPSILRPGLSSNDIDLDFTTAPVTLGATALPSNTLLVHNGEVPPGILFALDKGKGTVLDSMSVANGGVVVGGAFHARRGTWFAVSYNTNTISEVELQTGAILNSFPVQPAGSPAYTMFYGDLEVDPATGNLYVVSSASGLLRVLAPDGTWIQDYDLGVLGVTGLSGIAWDPVNRVAWTSSTNGMVYRVEGIDPA